MAAVSAQPAAGGARALNANACSFVSSRSSSAEGSPIRCGSPEDERALEAISPEAMAQGDDAPVPSCAASDADERRGGSSGSPSDVIPLPRPDLPRQRSSSSLQRSNSASPPPPPLPHPGLMPTYGWPSGPMPVFHSYPVVHYPSGPSSADMERSASPPAMFPVGAPPFPGGASPPYGSSPPLGASPPLPAGFVRVPIHTLAEPGSPTAMHPGHPYGGSPAFGGSPTHMAMAGSPPGGILYVPAAAFGPPPPPHHPHAHHPAGEFGMAHAGFAMHHPPEFVQRMSGLSLAQPGPPMQQPPQQRQQQQQQQQQRHERQQQGGGGEGSPRAAGYASSGGGGGRSEGRASARIARSHRAGGAYNPSEFEFDLAAAESGREGCRCTLMIRNIPNKYSQAAMLSILQKSGFSGTFDFFYLPIDFRNRCNLGYCFLKYAETHEAAAARG